MLPWIGCKHRTGHGRIRNENGGRTRPVYAIMYEVFYKDKVEKGEVVHHLCENPSCCNPHHLVKMTHKKHDKLHRGGEKCYIAKLTWEEVREIRKKYATGKYMQKELAEKYNISKTTIRGIINNKKWKE